MTRPSSPKIQKGFAAGKITMKIVVDYALCESNARCIEVAPDICEARDDDNLHVLNDNPPAAARDRVLRAIKICPKHAISLRKD